MKYETHNFKEVRFELTIPKELNLQFNGLTNSPILYFFRLEKT